MWGETDNTALNMRAEDQVIVLGRQFGCGGREIGKALAERLGVPYYDKELLRSAARRSGFDEDIFSRTDECRPGLKGVVMGLWSSPADGQYSVSAMSREGLYRAQSAVIADVAHAGPCVIVGRTADYVLRDMASMASIFLHAPVAYRAEKIVQRGECDNTDAAVELARRRDSMREQYYNYFTGRRWGYADNYHLCIDSSSMTTAETVQLMIHYLEHRSVASGQGH